MDSQMSFESVYVNSDKYKGAVQVKGTLKHPDGSVFGGQKVALYSPDWFRDAHLADTVTNSEGEFVLNYKNKCWRHGKEQKVLLNIIEENIPSLGVDGEMTIQSIPLSYEVDSEVDLGDIVGNLYEYKSDSTIPMLDTSETISKNPQQISADFILRVVRDAWSKKAKEFGINLVKNHITTETVQTVFGTPHPEIKLSCETTIDMILNGIYPCYFKMGENENELINTISWGDYDQDKEPDLPDVSISLNRENDKLTVNYITYQFPGEDKVTIKAGEPGFEKALYIFNCSALVKGEIYHLGLGHLMPGQLALAYYRNINNNPIKYLMRTHFDGVSQINDKGGVFIFNESGVLNVSRLSPLGVNQSLEDMLAGVDPLSFKPCEPIISDHRFAKAKQLYWKIVQEVVDEFFDDYGNVITSPSNWKEIYGLSQSLVKNSVAFKPFDGDPVKDGFTWLDSNEIDFSKEGRVDTKGRDPKSQLRSCRPITTSIDKPMEGDVQRLKQYLSFSLYQSTFFHWAIHTSQKKWASNLAIASIAPRFHGEGVNPDILGGTSVEDGKRQLSIVSTLVDFDTPPLVENRFGTTYQPLIDKLEYYADDFLELGYDIRKMHPGVII